MSVTMVVVSALVAVVLVAVASVIAAAETAFTRVNRSRADALVAAEAEDHPEAADHDDRVDDLQGFSRRPVSMLASLTFVQVAAQVGAVAAAFTLGRELGGRPVGYLLVAGCMVVLFLAVALSRSRALLAPDATAVGLVPILKVVAPLSVFTHGFARLVRRASSPTEPDPDVDEQQVLAIVGQTSGIDHEEEALIKRVVAFDDTVVGDIMTPRPDVVTLRSGFAVGDALQVATLHGLSRIPVTGTSSDIDDIIGAVHVKDLLVAQLDDQSDRDIDLWLRVAPVVPRGQRIANLLPVLQTGELHMAIVIDEHGGVAGVVTLEDILEEIVGEIEDEFDRPEPMVAAIDDRTVRADGRAEMARVGEALGLTFPAGPYRTVAGFVFSGLGHVPHVGETVAVEELDLQIEVVRMHGRRIAELELRCSAPFAMDIPVRELEESA